MRSSAKLSGVRKNMTLFLIVAALPALAASLFFTAVSAYGSSPVQALTVPAANAVTPMDARRPNLTPTVTAQASPTCSPGGGPYDIAIVFSDDAAPAKLMSYILAEPDVASLVPIDARFGTPNLASLLPYDEVIVYSNTEYHDPVALGDVIADYQDAGGVVVATNANWWGPPYGMEGRWMTGGYTMYTYPAAANNSTSTLGTYDPSHPLMQGVTALTAFFRNQVSLTSGAVQVAAWADGLPLVAYKTTNGHTAVGINAYLGFPEEGWDGDFGTLIVNAARWLLPASPCSSPTPQATDTATATATMTVPIPTDTVMTTPTVVSTTTATPAPATATATTCAITFTDVPQNSTFYPFIRCLACRGIVNGYDDDTFRPGNDVTRGQLAKIVSNSAGFSDPQPNQLFEDVPLSSTFQLYIGRLAVRSLVGGYPCGGPGEPCGSGNLPYFRPNAHATRGQTAIIVANTAGFTDPADVQIFEDVLPGSTFYDSIQRLASRGIVSGHPCGGPGEPCITPGNRPYFLPNNNATRGQSSKIVANTFYPACQSPGAYMR